MQKIPLLLCFLLITSCKYKVMYQKKPITIAVLYDQRDLKLSNLLPTSWLRTQSSIIRSSGFLLSNPEQARIHVILRLIREESRQNNTTISKKEKDIRLEKISTFKNANKSDQYSTNETINYQINVILWDKIKQKVLKNSRYNKTNTHSLISESTASNRMISNLEKIKHSQEKIADEIGFSIANDLQNEFDPT